MRKFKLLAASIIVIIAAFVCSVTAGADAWATDSPVSTDIIYDIDVGSSGTVSVTNGATLTVNGNVTGSSSNLSIQLQDGADLIWNASYEGSGTIDVGTTDGGAGSTVTINGAINSTNTYNALTISEGIDTVTINNNITGAGKAVWSSADETTISGGVQIVGQENGIYVGNQSTLNIGAAGSPATIESSAVAQAISDDPTAVPAAIYVNGSGVELNIINATIESNNIGVKVLNNNTSTPMTLDITNAAITAKVGIHTYGAANIDITAGTITASATDGIGIYATYYSSPSEIDCYNINIAAGVTISGDAYGLMIAESNAVVTTSGYISSTSGTAIFIAGSLEVTDGAITGVTGIFALDENANTNTIEISGGTITATGTTNDDSALCVDGTTTTVTITGGTITAEDTAAVYIADAYSFTMSDGTVTGKTGIYAEDVEVTISGDASIVGTSDEGLSDGVITKGSTEFVMTGGTIEADRIGINADESNGVIISGGTISAGQEGIYIREGRLTISEEDGTTTITATDEDSYAVWVNSNGSTVNISGGTFEAYNAIKLNCGDGGATITGGSFIATGSAGNGIMFGNGSGFDFDTTQGTTITIQGKAAAINEGEYRTPDYSKALYYITSEEYAYEAGVTEATFGITAVDLYENAATYQYVQFLSTPPYYTVIVDGGRVNGNLSATIQAGSLVTVTLDNPEGFVEWIVTGIELDDETGQTQEFTMPLNDVSLTASYEDKHTVTFDTNSAASIPNQTIEDGAKVQRPADPTKDGYTFGGWYTETALTTLFDFDTPIEDDYDLHAKWNIIDDEDPPAEEPAKPSNNDNNAGYTPGAIGPAPNGPASQSELDYILVIATLNKSGSVNSLATAEDISTAARTARSRGISKIYLKIPQDGTFISAPTMKMLLSAASRCKLTLIYDYYEIKNLRIVETIGGFFLPLNSSSGQILTGLYMGTERTARMEKYVADSMNRTVLGSFETEQTGGWSGTAEISLSTKKFGFTAEDGTKLEALIYDPRTAKWYRAAAEVADGKVVFKTTRTGIVVITALEAEKELEPVE